MLHVSCAILLAATSLSLLRVSFFFAVPSPRFAVSLCVEDDPSFDSLLSLRFVIARHSGHGSYTFISTSRTTAAWARYASKTRDDSMFKVICRFSMSYTSNSFLHGQPKNLCLQDN